MLVTVVAELITIVCRISFGQSAEQFNAAVNPPLVVKMHHMFWAIPMVLLAFVLVKHGKTRIAHSVFGASAGVVLSDLMHHFIVLPLWVGQTGWHWP